jgi:hypothetical protein
MRAVSEYTFPTWATLHATTALSPSRTATSAASASSTRSTAGLFILFNVSCTRFVGNTFTNGDWEIPTSSAARRDRSNSLSSVRFSKSAMRTHSRSLKANAGCATRSAGRYCSASAAPATTIAAAAAHHHRRVAGLGTRARPDGSVPRTSELSSICTSRKDWYRSSRSLARQRLTTWLRRGGVSLASVSSAGSGAFRMASIVEICEFLQNGCLPVTIS